MGTIIDLLEQFTNETPNTTILYDEAHTKGFTYAQFDDMTGRVYSYLKKNGIGKEDFVLINLPRGVMPIVAMIESGVKRGLNTCADIRCARYADARAD